MTLIVSGKNCFLNIKSFLIIEFLITLPKPKPMVEIGGKPILWHIMKIYSHYGFDEFIICLGYKGYLI